MKGCAGRGLRTLALLGWAWGAMAASARETGAGETATLERYAAVMLAKGRNEQCKVLDESRTGQFDDDVMAITKQLQKRVPAQRLLGVVLNATVATEAPESAAGCDEATRRSVEAGSEEARAWAEQLRRGRSRGNSTQGK